MQFTRTNINKTFRNGELVVSSVTNVSNSSSGGGSSFSGNFLPAINNGDGSYTVDINKVVFTGNVIGEGEVTAYGVGSTGGGSTSTGSVTIYDGLDSTATDVALSANQGRILREMIQNAGTGGSKLLSGLEDVKLTNLADGQILKYDLAAKCWVNGDGTKVTWANIEGKPAELTDANIAKWNKDSHTHSNKTILDGISQTSITNWNTAFTNNHTHSNKAVLDGITQANITSWNNKLDKAVWDKAFYFDSTGDLRAKVNVIGEKEISAYGAGTSTGGGSFTIVDALTSTATDAALSANQGRVLKDLIDSKSNVSSWNDLQGKPSWIGANKPTYGWNEIGGKPTTFTPAEHYHNVLTSNNISIQDLVDIRLAWTAHISSTSNGGNGYASQYGFPCANNANGVLHLGTHIGKFGGQLGVSSNGKLYYRFISNCNFPTFANGASWNTLAYTSDLKNYLPLIGGTLTGALGFNMNGVKSTIASKNSQFLHFETDAPMGFYFNKRVNINGDVYAGSKYDRRLAYIDEIANIKVKNSDALAIKDVRDAVRLPSYFQNMKVSAWFNNVGMPTNEWYSGLHVKGWANDYACWELASFSSNTDTNNRRLYFRNGVGDTWNAWKSLAFTSDLNRYLPLSGGTMTGALNFANGIWNKVGDDVAVGDHNLAGSLGVKSLNTANPSITFFDNSNTNLGSLTAFGNELRWRGNILWHAGNLDASLYSKSIFFNLTNGTTIDCKDWVKSEPYTRKAGNIFSVNDWAWASSANVRLNSGDVLDRQRYSALSIRNGNVASTWNQQAMLFLPTFNDSSFMYLEQMSTETTAGQVKAVTKRYADYDTILRSNVASATKLQTPRTIWGQSFDGTGNITGNFSSSGNINCGNTLQVNGTDAVGSYPQLKMHIPNVAWAQFQLKPNVVELRDGASQSSHFYGFTAGNIRAEKGIECIGNVKVTGNIIATGEIMAHSADGAVTNFLYNPTSYDQFTANTTNQAPTVSAVKKIKDKVEEYKAVIDTQTRRLNNIKTQLNSINSNSTLSQVINVLISIRNNI